MMRTVVFDSTGDSIYEGHLAEDAIVIVVVNYTAERRLYKLFRHHETQTDTDWYNIMDLKTGVFLKTNGNFTTRLEALEWVKTMYPDAASQLLNFDTLTELGTWMEENALDTPTGI